MSGASRTTARRLLLVALPLLWLLGASGCAVQAYQRERLVDRIMAFEADSRENARKLKAWEAREGSTGGIGGDGGGCACK